MFERATRAGLALCAVLCLASPARLNAQSARDLEARVDALAALAARADSLAGAYADSVARINRASDTLSVGVFRFITTRALMPIDRGAAALAERDLRRAFGTSVTRLSRYRLVVRESQRTGATDTNHVLVAEVGDKGQEFAVVETGRDSVAIAIAIKKLAARQLSSEAGNEFANWLGSTIPTDTMTAVGWSVARLRMVSSVAAVMRRCYDGGAADCEAVLGLRTTADPIMDWLDARGRRESVANHVYWPGSDSMRTIRRQCLAGDDPACETMLRSARFDPVPLGHFRTTLVQQATALGGDGALERLIATNGTPRERIAAAARVPFDSVVRAWQLNIHDTRVPSDAMRPSIAAASLAWMLVCAGLSLRSSRWR